MTILRSDWSVVDDARLELGEGARFVGGRFVLVDLLEGRLLSTTGEPAGGLTPEMALDLPLGAVAPDRAGRWIAAAGEGVIRLPPRPHGPGVTPSVTPGHDAWLAEPAAGRSVAMRMNDGVADVHGRFWAGAMPYEGGEGTGFLLRVDPDGSVHEVLTDLTIPNGPAFSADGARMFLADTPTGWIRSYDVDPATGDLGPARDLVHVDEGGPDGMTIDAEGCLWVAVWGAGCLLRFTTDGDLLERIAVPASQPTSIAISPLPLPGPDAAGARHRILVTTAAHGLTDPSGQDGRVLTAEVSVAGRPTDRWGGPSGV